MRAHQEPGDGAIKGFYIDRLREVILETGGMRTADVLFGTIPTECEAAQRGIGGTQLTHQLDAITVRQPDVGNDEFERAFRRDGTRLGDGTGGNDFEAAAGQQLRKRARGGLMSSTTSTLRRASTPLRSARTGASTTASLNAAKAFLVLPISGP